MLKKSKSVIIFFIIMSLVLGYFEYSDDDRMFLTPIVIYVALVILVIYSMVKLGIIGTTLVVSVGFSSLVLAMFFVPVSKYMSFHEMLAVDICDNSPNKIVEYYMKEKSAEKFLFEDFLFAGKSFSELKDEINQSSLFDQECKVSVYNSLGRIYLYEGVYDGAFFFFRNALELAQELKNDLYLAEIYESYGSMYAAQFAKIKQGNPRAEFMKQNSCSQYLYAKDTLDFMEEDYANTGNERFESVKYSSNYLAAYYECL